MVYFSGHFPSSRVFPGSGHFSPPLLTVTKASLLLADLALPHYPSPFSYVSVPISFAVRPDRALPPLRKPAFSCAAR